MVVIDDIIMKNKECNNFIALGSFDGLHYGHLSLIRKTLELAKKNNGKSMVFTYKNHPKTLIRPEDAPKLIMDLKTKIDYLKEEGIDIVILREFTKDFMNIEAEEFIKLLCETYNIKGIIVGFNFKFGYKNLGDIELLKSLEKKYDFKLHVMEPYKTNNEVISSTRIREAITTGNVSDASKMLLKPYSLSGEVIYGKQIGRTIGTPTANLNYNKDMIIPKTGVYYTNIEYNGKKLKGLTSVGYNPTVNGKELTVETFILNFDKMIYGEEIKVYFIERIRDEIKFNSLNELINQIEKDKDFIKYKDLCI